MNHKAVFARVRHVRPVILLSSLVVAPLWLFAANPGYCQAPNAVPPQAAVSVGGTYLSEGFYEHSGVSWTLIGPRGFVRFGPRAPMVSPFDSFGDPGAALGVGWQSGPFRGEFFGQWGHGFRRSFVGHTLEVTTLDGSWGSVGDQVYTPFVIGFFPVVGQYVPGPAPWPCLPDILSTGSPLGDLQSLRNFHDSARHPGASKTTPRAQNASADSEAVSPHAPAGNTALAISNGADTPLILSGEDRRDSPGPLTPAETRSSAERVSYGVAEALRRRAEELFQQNQLAESYLRQAESALEKGKPELAKIYLRLALKYASGDIEELITAKLRALEEETRKDP